ncbi:two-component sensor histidine kinase [Micromonospora sp. HM5-17]|nr:two-component sensor histidine kinase [Micromonospora sp. HM5-17]
MGLVGGLFGLADVGRLVEWNDPLALAVTLATVLALVAVRRWPWPVLVVLSVLMATAGASARSGDIAQLGSMVAVGLIAYSATWPVTAAAFGLTYTALLAYMISREGLLPGQQGFVQLAGFALIAGAPIALGRYLGGLRRAAQAAEERAREAEAQQEVQTRAARLAERTAIARDLHDIVAHHVGAIALQAGAAQYAAQRTGRVDDAVQALGELRATAGQVLGELRALLEVLRDPDAVTAGGPPIEPEQLIVDAEQRVRAAGVAVRMSVSGDIGDAPLVVRTTAARVVQEGLTNTLKHAGPGASASVDVRSDGDGLLVEVVDSGPEHPRPALLPPSGHGLAGMRERVRLLGGTLRAGPTDAGGWRLSARLPIPEKSACQPAASEPAATATARSIPHEPAGWQGR